MSFTVHEGNPISVFIAVRRVLCIPSGAGFPPKTLTSCVCMCYFRLHPRGRLSKWYTVYSQIERNPRWWMEKSKCSKSPKIHFWRILMIVSGCPSDSHSDRRIDGSQIRRWGGHCRGGTHSCISSSILSQENGGAKSLVKVFELQNFEGVVGERVIIFIQPKNWSHKPKNVTWDPYIIHSLGIYQLLKLFG